MTNHNIKKNVHILFYEYVQFDLLIISDQKNRVYFFESTRTPNIFWINFANLDFSPKAPVKKLNLANGEVYAGNAATHFVVSKPFRFLFSEM